MIACTSTLLVPMIPRGETESLIETSQIAGPEGSNGWRMVQAKAGPKIMGDVIVRLFANWRTTEVVGE